MYAATCPHCGTNMSAHAKFCSYCGASLSATDESSIETATSSYKRSIPENYPKLLEGYAEVVRGIYSLPHSCLWVPFSPKASKREGNKLRVPVLPLYLVRYLTVSHISDRLQTLTKYFSTLLVSEETSSAEGKKDEHLVELQRAIEQAGKIQTSLPNIALNKWIIFALTFVIVIALIYLTPFSPSEQAVMLDLIQGFLKLDVKGVMQALSNENMEGAARVLIDRLFIATLLIVPIIGIFTTKRWLFSHPEPGAIDRFCLHHARDDNVKCKGVYTLERQVFYSLNIRQPREIQLDSLIYILYFYPMLLTFSWALLAGWSFYLAGTYAIPVAALSSVIAFSTLLHGLHCWRMRSASRYQAFEQRKDDYARRVYQPDGNRAPETQSLALRRSPRLAAALSVLFPGLGQAYTGNIQRGLVIGILAVALASLSLLSDTLFVLFMFGLPTIWAIGVWDAWILARDYNLRHSHGEEDTPHRRLPKVPAVSKERLALGCLLLFFAFFVANMLPHVVFPQTGDMSAADIQDIERYTLEPNGYQVVEPFAQKNNGFFVCYQAELKFPSGKLVDAGIAKANSADEANTKALQWQNYYAQRGYTFSSQGCTEIGCTWHANKTNAGPQHYLSTMKVQGTPLWYVMDLSDRK
ncbi:MAG: zinc ribbon domain-containing protein [Halobacteriota archaeon]